MAAVDGLAAAGLAAVARDRWQRAGGPLLPAVVADADPWPQEVAPDLTDVTVGISRTIAPFGNRPGVREVEALYLRAIERARRWIYVENQYFTAPTIRDALARRLNEADGPEIVLICSLNSGGRADRLAMDRARNAMVQRLRAIDRRGRFRAVAPLTSAGEPIVVHSKVLVVDDLLLRIGSANLNNRSLALDTECDVSVEIPAGDIARRRAIRRLLSRLASEHIGCAPEQFDRELERTGSLLASIHALAPTSSKRLQDLAREPLTRLDRLVARAHLFDPQGVADNWRPWRRTG
jgi:phosphatidylserine/phosphatidylglycerophosphate/cardiolipin synthase-like enzyme